MVSAAFLDFDHDGFLDLYVGRYLQYSLDQNKACFAPTSARDYCAPHTYDALLDRLYRNRGDGSFEDISEKAGISLEFGPALGVIAVYFNGDSWTDIYVANDTLARALYLSGESQEALTQLQESVRQAPDNAMAQFLLGILLNENGNTQEAILHYLKTLILLGPIKMRIFCTTVNESKGFDIKAGRKESSALGIGALLA